MIFPFIASVRIYADDPEFARVFNLASLTDDQKRFYWHIFHRMEAQWGVVFFFGILTVLITVMFLLVDRRKIKDA